MTETYVILAAMCIIAIFAIIALCVGKAKKTTTTTKNDHICVDDTGMYGGLREYHERNRTTDVDEDEIYETDEEDYDEPDEPEKPNLDAYMKAEEEAAETGVEVENGIEAESGIKAQNIAYAEPEMVAEPEAENEPEVIEPEPEPVRAVVPVRKPTEQEFAKQRPREKTAWDKAKAWLWAALIVLAIAVILALAATAYETLTGQPIGVKFWTVALAIIATIFMAVCAIKYRRDKDAWVWWTIAIVCAVVAAYAWFKL
ncbi:MAG: hypothetical protein IJS47_00280 [Clostridia bacterium]|nr:hypothetical protein [Clostridia bacterium]